MRRILAGLSFFVVGIVALYGCSPNAPSAPASAVVRQGNADAESVTAILHRSERQQTEALAIRDRLEPYVNVDSRGHLILQPGIEGTGISSEGLGELQEAFSNINLAVDAGDLTVMADKSIVSRKDSAPAIGVQAWYGFRTYWWGFEWGYSDYTVHRILNELGNTSNLIRVVQDYVPGSYVLTVVNLYVKVLSWNQRFFDCCICGHSSEVLRMFWWAPLTPFLNCQ